MYLPALPAMADDFGTSSSMVQLGLTTSMIGLACGQLFFGPLSDKYGRRTPLLTAMWLFLGSTVLCIFAADIEQFVFLRFVQGIAGSGGIVISRSVATDKFSGRELAKMLALIGAINGIAPVAAPIVGGTLTGIIGWRGIFTILLGLGIVLLAGSFRFSESLPAAQPKHRGVGGYAPRVQNDAPQPAATCAISSSWGSPRAYCSPTSLRRPLSCSSTTGSRLSSSASALRSTPSPSGAQPHSRSGSAAPKTAPAPVVRG